MIRNSLSLARCGSALLLALLLATSLPAAAANPLEAIVGVRATIPSDARTAGTLGTERQGSGVVIDDDGLVLTIGYLIMESDSVELSLADGRTVPADIVAYDYDSGFGLLRPLARLGTTPAVLGDSGALQEQTPVLVASFGGNAATTAAFVVSRREFAGYWEYLLDSAIFTTPPHGEFGGAALLDRHGTLLGIGSLIVGDAAGGSDPLPGNMFVPIDILKPILPDLLAHGRAQAVSRPWLGVYTEEYRGHLFVRRVAPEGPAAQAGLVVGDLIVAVAGAPVGGQADFYRKLWALGEAGTAVPLTLLRRDGLTDITVKSGNRYRYLKLDRTY
ncbi:MAG: S1C family serine protease [Kiloniellales bacterium]